MFKKILPLIFALVFMLLPFTDISSFAYSPSAVFSVMAQDGIAGEVVKVDIKLEISDATKVGGLMCSFFYEPLFFDLSDYIIHPDLNSADININKVIGKVDIIWQSDGAPIEGSILLISFELKSYATISDGKYSVSLRCNDLFDNFANPQNIPHIINNDSITIGEIPVEHIIIKPSQINLVVGQSAPLSTELLPKGSKSDITWSSSDSSVVSIGLDGLVTAKYPGQAIVYATSENGIKGKCTVRVEPIALSHIKIETLPSKTTYIQGQALEDTGLSIRLCYNNGSDLIVKSGWTLDYNFDTTGIKTVVATYSNFCTSFDVVVNEKSISSININTIPNKTNYFQHEIFDDAGMSITINYNNNTSKTLYNGWSVEYDFSICGARTVIVKYRGFSTSVSVNVVAVKPISISIHTPPKKSIYFLGETPTSDGLSLMVKYNNGTSKILTSGWNLSYNFNSPGTKKVTINYKQLTTSYNVQVNDIKIVSISIKSPPSKTTYYQGESLVLTGGYINIKYNNNTSKTLAIAIEMISGYNSSKVGNQIITVTYKGFSDTFSIITKNKPQEILPSKISSPVYVVKNSTISKIPVSTTAKNFISNINQSKHIKLFSTSGKDINNNTLVSTGFRLKLFNGNKEVMSLLVIVTGDVNGDGKITLTDYAQMKAHLLNKSQFSSTYKSAADVNGDGKITLTDYAQMKAHLLNKGKISAQSH